MKAQAYPSSLIKVGAVLHSFSCYVDDGKSTFTAIEWHVTAIQARKKKGTFGPTTIENTVYLTRKQDGVSWGKRSTKTGDYGWLKSIPATHREKFLVGADLPRGIYTTPRQAVLYAIHTQEVRLARYRKWADEETDPAEMKEWVEILKAEQRAIDLMRQRIKRMATKRAVRKRAEAEIVE